MRELRFLALSLTLSMTVGAVDWPQFRFGANRGASSPEVLAGTLHLQWTREFAAPSPAFPVRASPLSLRMSSVTACSHPLAKLPKTQPT